MRYLLDVSVLWPIIDSDHSAHGPALRWIDGVHSRDKVLYDVVVRMAILRHFTREPRVVLQDNPRVVQVIDEALRYHRIEYATEPPDVWEFHDRLLQSVPPRQALNTDLYLVALATALDATFVTFDRAIARRFPEAPVLTLGDVE